MKAGARGRVRIGERLPRKEDARLLMGRGRYVDDVSVPGMAHACMVRSPHPHARIVRIDTAQAARSPGVLAVLTGAHAAADGLGGLECMTFPAFVPGTPHYSPKQPVLAHERVRHAGFPVAVVVAETLHQAKDAAELVAVDYEPLAAAVSLEAAMQPGAPRVWDEAPDNTCCLMERGDRKLVDAAFARAAHVVQASSRYPRAYPAPMEPRSALGRYDAFDGRYTLYTGIQQPHRAREYLSEKVLDVPETDIRVITPDVGGAFGMRGTVYPEEVIVLWASRRIGRPVKWTGERHECVTSDMHGRDQLAKGEIALDASGRILAVRAQIATNVGSYLAYSAGAAPTLALTNLTGAYHIPLAHSSLRAVFTHTNPLGPYRGTGRPEMMVLIERLVEKAARLLGVDSLELRRRNLVRPEAMPFTTPGGTVMDCGDLEGALDRALRLADGEGYAARKAGSEQRGLRRGRAVCLHAEHQGSGQSERTEVQIDASGAVTVVAGTVTTGQGHDTMYAQLVSDWLGVPVDHVRVRQGDTDQVMFGRGAWASRTAMQGGGSLKLAVDEVIEKAKRLAAHMMEAAPSDIEFRDGWFAVAGTDRRLPLAEVARKSYARFGLPPQFEIGLEAAGSYFAEETYPYGCTVCEVEVDPATGRVRIDRFSFVDDAGVLINPLIVEGQIHGSLAMGIGQVLTEEVLFDAESGQLLSGSFLDYAMPRADLFPTYRSEFMSVPTKTNMLGVKGGSESGNFGGPPAVLNAIYDALAPLGVTELPLPATAQRIWRAIEEARTARA